MENPESEKITFKDLKKKMTEERVLKSQLEGRTQKIMERMECIEAGNSSSSSVRSFYVEDNSEVEDDDLFLIIRSNNTKEMLINGRMVADPVVIRSSVKTSSSGDSLSGLVIGAESGTRKDAKYDVGSQAGRGFVFEPKDFKRCPRCEGGGIFKEPTTKSSSEESVGGDSSSGDETESSSNKSSSSQYSDTKDVLKQTILQYGECGPKRLTAEVEKRKTNRPPLMPKGQPKPGPSQAIFKAPQKPGLMPTMLLKPDLLSIQNKTKTKTKKEKPKNFLTYVGTKSYVSKGLKKTKHSNFQYHLSDEESKIFNANKAAMKVVPEKEKRLLNDGLRRQYLDVRNEKGPVTKYHYPEATSWRYGWLIDQNKKST